MKHKILVLFIIIIIAVIFSVFLFIYQKNNTYNKSELKGLIFNTGKSDAVLITYKDYKIIIDTAYDENSDEILSYLNKKNINTIDYMILTHFDKDHIGGADKIINSVNVKNVYMPDYESDSNEYKELKEVCEKNNISVISLREDKYINLDELIINISVPKNDFYEDENDYSLITSVELAGNKMLFMGDACKIRCSEYAENINEKYIFIKLPHHGDYNKYIETIISKAGIKYSAVTLENEDDMETKLVNCLKKYSVRNYCNCNGNIFFNIYNGKFTIYQ